MRQFLSTEYKFENGVIKPTAIAIVAEDGRELILVTPDYEQQNQRGERDSVEFRDHVMTIDNMRDYINAFLCTRNEFWGYCCHFDWVVLSLVYGGPGKLPSYFPFTCYDTAQKLKGIDRKVSEPFNDICNSRGKNALSDARWVKVFYNYLTGQDAHLHDDMRRYEFKAPTVYNEMIMPS